MGKEKTLKKLLQGDLAILQNQMSTCNAFALKGLDDLQIFSHLLVMLGWVTEFQYNHHHKMDEIKKELKKDPKIFEHLGPLYGMIKICGMDQYKSQKHHSFISNHFHAKKDLIGLRKFVPLHAKQVFLSTNFYTNPQRLTFVKIQAGLPTSPMNKVMVQELFKEVKTFMFRYSSGISEHIQNLKIVLNLL
jgi:hypothetical protein